MVIKPYLCLHIVLVTLVLFYTGCGKITAPADVIPPATPSNFILIGGGDGEARFRWAPNSEPDLNVYIIYRAVNTLHSFNQIVELRENEFVDRFLSYDSTYYYYITAMDNANNESAPSGILDVRPVNISSPPSPSSVVVYGHNNPNLNETEFRISWIPPIISDLEFFRVYRGTSLDFIADETNLVGSTAVSLYNDRTVGTGDLYYYKIICVDQGGKASVPSAPDFDRILAPVSLITPGNRTVQPQSVIFGWRAVADAVGYQVFVGRGPFSNIVWNSATTTNLQVQYSGAMLSSNNIYYWWVGAYSKEPYFDQTSTVVEPEINAFSEIWSFFIR